MRGSAGASGRRQLRTMRHSWGTPVRTLRTLQKVGDPQIAEMEVVKGYWITARETAQETHQPPPWERV